MLSATELGNGGQPARLFFSKVTGILLRPFSGRARLA